MKTIATILFLLLLVSNSYSTTYDYEYTNIMTRYSNSALPGLSYGNKSISLCNSNCYTLIRPASAANTLFLSKFNYLSGQTLWEKSWGTNGGALWKMSISPDSSNIFVGGYIMGDTEGQTNNGFENVYLAKIHADDGTTEWSRIFGSTNLDTVTGITLDSHTNVFIYGTTCLDLFHPMSGFNKIFLTKYDDQGNFLWNKIWSTTNGDWSSDVAVDKSNNVYLLGRTLGNIGSQTNQGTNDIFIIKTDNDGNAIWTKMMGTTNNDYANSLAIDDSTNIIIHAYTYGNLNGQINTGNLCLAVIKLDVNGNQVWTKLYAGTNFYRIDATDNGSISINQSNIYISSSMSSNGYGSYTYIPLLKFNSSGSNIWTKIWPSPNLTNYCSHALSQDINGNMAILDVEANGGYNSKIQFLFPLYDLVINGSPAPYQTNSLPLTYGTNRVARAIPFTNSIALIYQTNSTWRFVCTGWNGTGGITNGFTNTVVFAITNDSTLTWNWQKQYWVSVSNTADCSVNYINGTNGWNNEGIIMGMSAYPQIYFQNWNIQPLNATPTNNPLYLPPLTNSLSVTGYFGYEDNGYGMAFEWVVHYWGVSYNPTKTSDYNHDGITDYQAYLAGIDPTVSNNNFFISSIFISNGIPIISWNSDTNRYFTIMGSTNLNSTNWIAIGGTYASGAGYYTDNGTNKYSFYKVVAGVN